MEVYKFSKLTPATIAKLPAKRQREWQAWAARLEKGLWLRDGGTPDLPTLDELGELAEQTRRALGWTVRGMNWPSYGADLQITESGIHWVGKHRWDTFMIGVAEIVIAARHSLRQCQRNGCSEIFIALRRKEFCTAKCAARERSRRGRDQRLINHLVGEGFSAAEAKEIVDKKRAERIARHNARLERAEGFKPEPAHPRRVPGRHAPKSKRQHHANRRKAGKLLPVPGDRAEA
jgi:hypothetical protein